MKKIKKIFAIAPIVAASVAFAGCGIGGTPTAQVVTETLENLNVIETGIVAPYRDNASGKVRAQIDELKSNNSYTQSNPLVMYNPYGTIGLSLYVYFQTEEASEVSYTISVPDESIPDFGGKLSKEASTEHEYTLLGIVPGQVNTITITTTNSSEERITTFDYACSRNVLTEKESVIIESTDELTIVTPENGSDVGPHEVTLAQEKSDKTLADGLFLMMGNYSMDESERSYAYMYDNSGVMRGKICCGLAKAGNILFDNENECFYACVSASKIAKINKLGEAERIYPLGNFLIHHDCTFDNDGNIVFLSTDNSQKKDVEDCITKLDVQTGEITNLLDLTDLFGSYEDICVQDATSTYGAAGEGLDWMHINSIYLVGDDAFLSARETSTIIKINDLATNPSIGYMIGSENFWRGTTYDQYLFTKVNEFDIQGGQHHLMYFPSNQEGVYNLTMYNNNMGYSSSRPDYDWKQDGFENLNIYEENEPSYYYNYKINENDRTVELVDSIAVPTSGIVSSAQTLENGNIVTDSGVLGIFSEYDSEGKLIKGYACPPISRFLYRVFKYDFKGFFFQ